MSDFATNLDQALNRLRQGETPTNILADYPARQGEFMDELLAAALALDMLRPASLPAVADLSADREKFLAELDQLTLPAVSVGPLVRLKSWMTQQPSRLFIQTNLSKEQRRMNGILVKAMLVFTLVFGAGSGVAMASADSLPGAPLYPLKIGLEEVRLALTGDPVQQASQWQERVRERADEIARMAMNGQPIGEAELARLKTQTQSCLQQAAALPDPVMAQQLEQFLHMAQEQQQVLAQAGATQTQAAVQTMTQARQAAEEGLANPAVFRYRYGQRRPDEAPPQPTPIPTQAPAPTLAPTPVEVVSPTVEPTLAPTVTPVRPRHTPSPTGDANRYGPQPTQPGPGRPGGNPEATCTPTGDANRYGAPPATSQSGGNSDNSDGSDNSSSSGGSSDSGGGSDNSGGGSGDSGGSDNSGGSGGSSDSGGGSGDSGGDTGGSGGGGKK